MQESMICAGDVLAEIVSSDILEGEDENETHTFSASCIGITYILC